MAAAGRFAAFQTGPGAVLALRPTGEEAGQGHGAAFFGIIAAIGAGAIRITRVGPPAPRALTTTRVGARS